MARILNFLIFIFEIIAFYKARKRGSFAKSFIFYTQISNLIALIASVLLVIMGQHRVVEILRLLATSLLAMTFVVTACILAPASGKVKDLLFKGSSLFHHFLIPVLSVISYRFAEDRAPMVWIWLPVAVTLIYGLTMVFLNSRGRVDGPYPFFRVKENGPAGTALWMAGLILVSAVFSCAVGYRTSAKTDVKFVFVHGLSGWGSYDTINEFIPYWGLTTGSITRYLNNKGYESYAASVDPQGSAWDRACELYAQLAGTRVDYGKAHSEAAGHERFGEDFTGRALIKDFETSNTVFIGHSFGGATVRLFSELLKNGSEAERKATDESDLSPFFRGGNGDGLVAVVTLAAPTNGTTAYDMYEDESFDISAIEIPEEYEKNSGSVSKRTRVVPDGRVSWDYASFDMHIDNALALNETITTFEDVYYFAYPCSSTIVQEDGSVSPDPAITENMFMKGSTYMSNYTGTTKGGFVIDESWRSNDGLVNEISAGAPIGAPARAYDPSRASAPLKAGDPSADPTLEPGIWSVMPTYKGDHMSLQGGLTIRKNVKPFYLEMVKMISGLSR